MNGLSSFNRLRGGVSMILIFIVALAAIVILTPVLLPIMVRLGVDPVHFGIVMIVALAHKGGMRFAPLLMTGVLGGFTTFSAFSLDAITLFERGQTLQAGAYVLGSVVTALIAIMAGMAATRMAGSGSV